MQNRLYVQIDSAFYHKRTAYQFVLSLNTYCSYSHHVVPSALQETNDKNRVFSPPSISGSIVSLFRNNHCYTYGTVCLTWMIITKHVCIIYRHDGPIALFSTVYYL